MPYARFPAMVSLYSNRPMAFNISSLLLIAYSSSCLYVLVWTIASSMLLLVLIWHPILTLSRTLMNLNSCRFWKVLAIRFLATLSDENPVTSSPIRYTFPLVGVYIPVHILKNVVFPAPFGPMIPKMSPAITFISTFSTAFRPPKYLHKPFDSRIGTLLSILSKSIMPSSPPESFS